MKEKKEGDDVALADDPNAGVWDGGAPKTKLVDDGAEVTTPKLELEPIFEVVGLKRELLDVDELKRELLEVLLLPKTKPLVVEFPNTELLDVEEENRELPMAKGVDDPEPPKVDDGAVETNAGMLSALTAVTLLVPALGNDVAVNPKMLLPVPALGNDVALKGLLGGFPRLLSFSVLALTSVALDVVDTVEYVEGATSNDPDLKSVVVFNEGIVLVVVDDAVLMGVDPKLKMGAEGAADEVLLGVDSNLNTGAKTDDDVAEADGEGSEEGAGVLLAEKAKLVKGLGLVVEVVELGKENIEGGIALSEPSLGLERLRLEPTVEKLLVDCGKEDKLSSFSTVSSGFCVFLASLSESADFGTVSVVTEALAAKLCVVSCFTSAEGACFRSTDPPIKGEDEKVNREAFSSILALELDSKEGAFGSFSGTFSGNFVG